MVGRVLKLGMASPQRDSHRTSGSDGTILYLDYRYSYMTVYTSQNLYNCITRVNFTVCKVIIFLIVGTKLMLPIDVF